jgi:hypothetical protein
MSRARDLADLGGSADAGGLTGRNLIINGAMTVAQRGTSSTGVGSANGYFTVDRFQVFTGSTAGRATMSQVADGPDGFANSLKFECTTSDTTIAAGENFGILQILEGQDLQHLKKGTSNAESLTLSFYVKGNASATYTVEMKDNDNDRINTQKFDVTTSWNRVSLTFVPDTTGALDNDNLGSFQFGLWLHAGSDFTGGTFASNTWAAKTNGNRVYSTQTSFFDSTSRTFFITGVQLEVGETATPFEHEDFATTLRKCQRYFQAFKTGRVNTSLVSVASSTSQAVINMPLQVEPRALASYDGALASGTFTKTGTVAVNAFPSSGNNVTSIAFWVCNSTEISVGLNTSATLVQYNGYMTRVGATAGETVFTLDVEL